jgi:hypothetical protein
MVLEAMERGWARERLERAQRELSSDTPSYHEFHSSQNPLAWDSQVNTAVKTHSAASATLLRTSFLSRAPFFGLIRRARGSIVPEDDFWDGLNQVQTQGRAFRFRAKIYFLTWSQIGDLPNSALEDKMASFGNLLKSESLYTHQKTLHPLFSDVCLWLHLC